MKVIIAGSRTLEHRADLIEEAVLQSKFTDIDEVVCGMARGIDLQGRNWALKNHKNVKEMPADWTIHGRRAGFIRNVQMAEYADALIAIYDGRSRGTAHMIRIMNGMNKPVFVLVPGQ